VLRGGKETQKKKRSGSKLLYNYTSQTEVLTTLWKSVCYAGEPYPSTKKRGLQEEDDLTIQSGRTPRPTLVEEGAAERGRVKSLSAFLSKGMEGAKGDERFHTPGEYPFLQQAEYT